MIEVPIRTVSALNAREHYMRRAKRVKAEREATAWMLKNEARPPLPCTVRLIRMGPTNGLDSDNLEGALKGVRDEVAEWLGVNDRDAERVAYDCRQMRSKHWGVGIDFLKVELQ